jgi:hypothetical protein
MSELNESSSPIPQEVLDELQNETVPELTLEDLFGEQVNQEQVDEAARKMLLPVGTYTTEPPFTPTVKKDKNGRLGVRFWGTAVLGDVKGKIGYGLSHIYKPAVDWETGEVTEKPDRAYKNYVQASKAYKIAHGQEASNVGEIVAYLRDYPHKLRVIQTSDGENMVVVISAVRPE